MKSDWIKFLLILLLLFSACRKSETYSEPSSPGIFGLSDETEEAAKLVDEANTELKKIKTIYKESNAQAEELKEAMKNNEYDKVKKLAGELVKQIDEGMNLGKGAVEKVGKAEDMNINEKFKEYLGLKKDALNMQLKAFDYRFEAAKFLRDKFDARDKAEIEKAKATLKKLDDEFQKLMNDARELSQDANLVYKESKQKESS